jgi:hypothetical protein
VDGRRQADLGGRFFDCIYGVAQRDSVRKIEGDGSGGKQSLVVDRKRRIGRWCYRGLVKRALDERIQPLALNCGG